MIKENMAKHVRSILALIMVMLIVLTNHLPQARDFNRE